jgi:hypothetical protein
LWSRVNLISHLNVINNFYKKVLYKSKLITYYTRGFWCSDETFLISNS